MHRFILCLNCSPISFEAVYCFICGRLRVAVARYRMICLVLLFQSLVQHCTLTNKAVRTSRRALSQHHRGDKAPSFVPSDCYLGLLQLLDLSSFTSFAEHNLLSQNNAICHFLTYYHHHLCIRFLWPFRLRWLFAMSLKLRFVCKFLNVCQFDCTTVTGIGKIGP